MMQFSPFIFATTGTEAAAAPAATTEAGTPVDGTPAPAGGGIGGMMLPLLLFFGLFYFMMIRPQQRKEKERVKMISELRAGKRVSFAGGFIGTIKEAKEKTFVIEIAPDVKVEVVRGAVNQVIDELGAEAAK